MENGDKTGTTQEWLRKALVPGAASIVGAGAGLLLTKNISGLRRALPDLKDLGVGDLAGDLRGRLDGVLGKSGSSSSRQAEDFDADELAARRRERGERRTQRRKQSRG